MSPEVVKCETNRDNPYDYKTDIWSLGITLIEFAQRDPPNNQMNPMRVLLKILLAEPPKLDSPSQWSKQFNDFLAKCLIKDPQSRPTATDLLEHPFIKEQSPNEKKSILLLINEFKAEVVEEIAEVEDDATSTTKETSIPRDDSFASEASENIAKESKPSPPKLESVEEHKKKRPAPKPPVIVNANATDKPQQDEANDVKPTALATIEEKPLDVGQESLQLKEPEVVTVSTEKEKEVGDRILINNTMVEDEEDVVVADTTVAKEKVTVNDNEPSTTTSSENCQVTISSNHSTIINTNEKIEESKSNISIVTIESGKGISIKSADNVAKIENNEKSTPPPPTTSSSSRNNSFDESLCSLNSANQSEDSSPEDKVSSSASSNLAKSDIEQAQPVDTKSNSSGGSSIGKTTIKVNLSVIPEAENVVLKNGVKNSNGKLTRIDQVNSSPINGGGARKMFEKGARPSEAMISGVQRNSSRSSSNFSSLSFSDKENHMGNSFSHESRDAVMFRKKRDMVRLVDCVGRCHLFMFAYLYTGNENTEEFQPSVPVFAEEDADQDTQVLCGRSDAHHADEQGGLW